MMLKLLNLLVGSSDVIIKIRLSVYVLTLTHLAFMSTYLLGLDFSKSKDPQVQAYAKLKWKLITAWFNLLAAPYLVMSIYCDWNHLQRNGQSKNVRAVNRIRNFLFTSIILPVTVFGDLLFWRLYNKDRRLLMPLTIDEFISIGNNHSMHTVSLLFVLFDLVSVPRQRPKDMTHGIIALTAFITLYISVCLHSVLKGEYVYPGLRMFSASKLAIGGVYLYIANFFYYTGQWFIVDIVWGQRRPKMKMALRVSMDQASVMYL